MIEGVPPDPMLERRELIQQVAHKTLRRRMLVSKVVVAMPRRSPSSSPSCRSSPSCSPSCKRASTGGASTFSPRPRSSPPSSTRTPSAGSRTPSIGSLVIDGIAALFAIPIGVITGLFLAESDSRLANALRTTAEIMTGLPSILLGIFAYQMIVIGFHEWGINLPGIGFSGIAGSFAIGILMIPVIIKASENGASQRALSPSARPASPLGLATGVVARKVDHPDGDCRGSSPPCCWRCRAPSARRRRSFG